MYFGAAVVRMEPWYTPRYLNSLFGMIVGNAMNAAALAAERLRSEMSGQRAQIEPYLALGASPEKPSHESVRRSPVVSLIPTVNALMVVGVVSLPGMMTGQILAGSSPLTAVRYQIIVMFMLASSVAVTATLVTLWYRHTCYTDMEPFRAE